MTMMAGQQQTSPVVDRDWIVRLPKAENHVHLEGCFDAAVVAQAAQREGCQVPVDPPTTLDELLHLLDVMCGLMTEPEDLSRLAAAKARAGDEVGVAYTDLIVNPAHWPAWSGRVPEMIAAIDDGLALAESEGSAPVGLSLSIGRHQSAAEATALLEALTQAPTHRVVGISIDGNESAIGAGCGRFEPVFSQARDAGLRSFVHTGESGGPHAIRLSIDHLRPDRIDHGIRSVESPALVEELVESGTPLAICPTSNLKLGFVEDLAQHPIRSLRDAGVTVTLNTDDPLLLETDLANEYLVCAQAFRWGPEDMKELAAASVTASSAPPELQADLLEAIEHFK